MHIKVNVYANTGTLTRTHVPVSLWCTVDLNGLCGNESSPIKCLCESERFFQLQINLKAPLPDHGVGEWMVTGERKGPEI